MKFKRAVSKLLACTMMVTTVFTGNVSTTSAAAKILQPVAKYDFEEGVSDDNGKYQDIQMITKDLKNYTGQVELVEGGKTGKAINIYEYDQEAGIDGGKYGLKLPQKKLGNEYTVSVWVKNYWSKFNARDSKVPAVISIGKSAEKNITLKVPEGDNSLSLYLYSGDTRAEGNMTPSNWKDWHMLTITQSGSQVICYLDNQKALETTAEPMLDDEEGSIYFGVNQGGGGYFSGYYDDISVYNVALEADQVSDLFAKGTVEDNRTPDKIFETHGITVSPDSGTVAKGKTLQLAAVVPQGVPAEDVTITYQSSADTIAAVSSTGLVTGVEKGSATITAKAVYNSVEKTATAAIEVKGTPEDILKETETIDVTQELKLDPGKKGTIQVNLPAGLIKEDCTISFNVKDSSDVISVNAATGEVTAVKAGTAEVVTSVTVGSTTKTGTTNVKVRSVADILREEPISVSEGFRIEETATEQIEVTLPDGVTKDDVNITYAVKAGAASGVATVSATGLVTGVKAGTTVITTTVTSKTDASVSKSADTNVRVIGTQASTELAVDYDFYASEGDKVKDISNNGNDAVIKGTNAKFGMENGVGVMTLGANTYLELPTSIMGKLTDEESFTIETTFARSASCGSNAWLFCLGSNAMTTNDSANNYLFLSPNFNPGIVRSGIKGSGEEFLFTTEKNPGNDTFHTIDMVFDKGLLKLYMDGVLIKGNAGDYSVDSKLEIMKDVVNANTSKTVLGYIGKSLYKNDGLFQGKLSSFKIYKKALTDTEIQKDEFKQAFQKEAAEGLELTAVNLGSKNPSVDEVKYDLASLPKEYKENAVTWKSANTDIIADDGKVYNDESADKTVKLTATVVSGEMKATKDFTLTVLKADKEALNKAIADANAKIAEEMNYRPESIESLKAALKEAQEAKGQTRIDAAEKKLTKAISDLVTAKGDRDPFAKITPNCYKTSITLEPTKTAAVFQLPSSLKLNEDVTIKYETSNSGVATVSADGVVTAQKKVGYARITTTVKAVYDGFEMEYQTLVKVNHDISKVSVSANETNLAKGKKATITVVPTEVMKNAGFTVKYAANGAVSVKDNVVTASKSGKGTVAVTISSAGKTITKRITFHVGEITGKGSVKVKKSITLKVKGLNGKVSWSLDKKGKKLAKISKSGKLTAKKKKGTVKVTAKVKVGNKTVTLTKSIKIKK